MLSEAEAAEIHLERTRLRLPAGRRLTARAGRGAALINLTAGAVKIASAGNALAGTGKAGKAGKAGSAGRWVGVGVGVVFAPDIVSPRDGEVVALSDCELCCFSEAGLRRLFSRHPRLQESFLRHSLEALRRAREQAALLSRPRAAERVAALLWSAVRAAGLRDGGDDCAVAMPMRNTEAALLLGLSKETVSRCLAELRTAGLLHPVGRRRYQVPDPDALREMCGG